MAHLQDDNGLIPAHAGKTAKRPESRPARPAHPRSRGENRIEIHRSSSSYGSSPLTRGKLLPRGQRARFNRLIPAHAGKTIAGSGVRMSRAAHPRSRGENASIMGVVVPMVGSSPLTRGKLLPRGQRARFNRLIPAHAGKTSRSSGMMILLRAHPRSRGENFAACVLTADSKGSSPLTRGKR